MYAKTLTYRPAQRIFKHSGGSPVCVEISRRKSAPVDRSEILISPFHFLPNDCTTFNGTSADVVVVVVVGAAMFLCLSFLLHARLCVSLSSMSGSFIGASKNRHHCTFTEGR